MTSDAKRLVLVGVVSLAAGAITDGIYYGAIVPRLPGWPSVPWYWWAVDFAPVMLALVAAGRLCPGVTKIPYYAVAFIVPFKVIQAARGLSTGEPVVHDAWVGDPEY